MVISALAATTWLCEAHTLIDTCGVRTVRKFEVVSFSRQAVPEHRVIPVQISITT